jgi:alkaline phosphatase D
MRYLFPALVCLAGWLASPPAGQAADETRPLSRIAFGSCAHQDRPQPIWGPIAAAKPELFLLIGDSIYADTEDIEEMRRLYARFAELPGFKKLRASCPVLGTWDDHDYGANDVGAEYPKKKESQQAFLDFLQVPRDSPRRKQEGVYDAVILGPPGKRVQIILLDTRYHRSALTIDRKRPRSQGQYVASTDPKATILGETQWKWLGEQLKKPAELRLLVSSIQVVAEDHGFEKWMNFPRERERLYRLLGETKAAGVIVLSGDRHLAELSVMDAGIGYRLLDLTSSGLNQASKRWRALETNRHRVATMNRGDNFGMVRIDWDRPDPLVVLEILDDEGDVIIRHKVPLSRLQPGGTGRTVAGGVDLAAEAMKQVGKEWKVELTVQATGMTRTKTRVFLNSEPDFRSERNLTIVLDVKALAKDLKTAKIDSPAKHFAGKKVRVTGKVSLYNKRPQIVVEKLEQIEVVM